MNDAKKEPPSSDIGKYIQLFGLLLVLGVIGSSYMKKEGGEAHSADQSSKDSTSSSVGSPVNSSRAGELLSESLGESIAAVEGWDINDINDTTSLASFTRQVRPAIVSVKTSWGRGSGFFIRKNFIITCKHVIEPDLEKLTALQEQVHRNRQRFDFEEEKLSSYQARLGKMRRGGSKDTLKLLITERERYLADFRFRQEKDESDLAEQEKGQEHPAISYQIILADGTEQSASLVQMSQEYDLALLTVVTVASVQDNPVLEPAPSGSLLRLDDPVFVLGGSAGPEKSVIARGVTTGSFSGYRRVGVRNQMFLQIDVEIVQEKSGGPVLDAAGHVRGIATKTVRAGKGVGFALPIERVFDEFAAVLP